jgi:hemolysin III
MTAERIDVHGLVKPLLRGRLHLAAVIAAVPAAIVLVAMAGSTHARVAAAVYGVTLVALFGVSGTYHQVHVGGRLQQVLRRADHATIYGLIAGSYTPVALVAVGGAAGWILFVAAWTVAALGMSLKIVWFDHTNKVGGFLYIAMGWMVVGAAPWVIAGMTVVELVLFALGGLLYTGGAIVLATRRPNPNPRVFGYHEVWHTCVIVAAACHYAAMVSIVS